MVNNKPTGPTFTRFLPIVFISLAMTACSSPPLAPEAGMEPYYYDAPAAAAAPVVLQRDYPERYVVKRGDTLWDIAQRFLKDPWLWPQVWHINPEIRNPHLIYPGDVILLYYDADGRPFLTLEGPAAVPPGLPPQLAPPRDIDTVKLQPRIRIEPIEQAITTIPRAAIAPFLHRPRVVTRREIRRAPYIVANYEGHLISATGNVIYARNVTDQEIGSYDVVRPGEEYRDPRSGRLLGYEVIRLAEARVTRAQTGRERVTTLTIGEAFQEVLTGDLLLPAEQREFELNFFPRPPSQQIDGQIISVFRGLTQIGQYNVVVLNKGERDGLEPGHVLAIFQKGERVRDPGSLLGFRVTLPDERAGTLMVFRTYERVSYALIMEALRPLHLNDRVSNP